jgi:hypothetical protein
MLQIVCFFPVSSTGMCYLGGAVTALRSSHYQQKTFRRLYYVDTAAKGRSFRLAGGGSFICSLFNDAFSVTQTIQRLMKWQANDKLERIRKEAVVAQCKVLSPTLAERNWVKPRKSSVRIAGLRAKIWIRVLPNTKQEQGKRWWRRHWQYSKYEVDKTKKSATTGEMSCKRGNIAATFYC